MESEWIKMFRQIQQPPAAGYSTANRVDSRIHPRVLGEDRQTVDTFRAVLCALFGLRCLSGRKLRKPFLFILYSEAHTASDSQPPSAGDPVLPEHVRRGITRGSDNLPMRIMWMKEDNGAGRDPGGEFIPSGGAVVRFTGIRREKTGRTWVKGIIHRSGMEPRGFEFEVEKRGGFSMIRNFN